MEADFGSLVVMLVALAVLIVSIMKCKVHPVVALILVALGSAVAFRFPIGKVVSTVTGGFGSTIGSIGIVIILGCAIGVILEETGGALVLANTILKWVGKKRTSLAMAISGYLVSIPVFSDSAIVILSPVARSLSARSGVPLMCLLGSLNAGILATHTMVPPTPGPLAATMFWCKSSYCVSRYLQHAKVENIEQATNDDFSIKTDRKLPSAFLTFACILVPVILICVHSFMNMALPAGAPILVYSAFLGHPVIALFIGVFLCLFLDASKLNKEQVYAWFDRAVESSGFIILATGTAGSFGAVLKASGVGTYLGRLIAATPLIIEILMYLMKFILDDECV